MVLFMSWMTGSNLNIFTIIMTFSMLLQPITAFMNLRISKALSIF